MKIMQVVESFGGGVYTFLVDLCNELSKDNEVIIVYSKRKETPENFKDDFSKNIKFIEVEMVLKKIITSSYRLSKIIKKEKPNVVHLHSSKAGVIGRVAKVISNYRGKLFYNPHGLAFLRQDLSINKRKALFLFEKILAKLGGHVIGVSESEWEEIKKITKNSSYINNWIDIDKIKGISKRNENKKIKIGIVGRITYAKNPVLFNNIATLFPELNFVWIGEGELVERLTSKNIEITGWLKGKEFFNKLNCLDIYIQTSLWEGLPVSVLEAMALGKPLIVSNVIGNINTVRTKENGFICDSIKEYTTAIKLLVEDKLLREEMGKKSKLLVDKKFSKNNSVKKYKERYEKLKFG